MPSESICRWPERGAFVTKSPGRLSGDRSVKESLKTALVDARSLWFLCSGNVVRSAFAEVYARHKVCPIPVRSAATRFRNDAMFPQTVSELKARGVGRVLVDRFAPVHLDDVVPDLRDSDVVLGMTEDHIQDFRAHVDTPRALDERSFLLGDAFWNSEEIADPVLDGADYAKTFARIAKAVETLLVQIKTTHRVSLRR